MRVVLAIAVAVGVTYKTQSTLAGALVGFVLYLALSYNLIRGELGKLRRPSRWWSHTNLVQAMTAADILPTLKPDQPAHVLNYKGKPQRDASGGTTVAVALPKGLTYSKVRARREALASAFGVPTANLDLTQKRGDTANVVRIWIGTGERPHRTAPIASAHTAKWSEPALIGTDDRGRDVTIATQGTHTAFVGGTGSGKTWTARVFVAHAILDERVHIDAIIAKDNVNDWRPMAPRCGTYIGGATKTAVQAVEQLLLDVEQDSEERQGQTNPPPRVLVVEEWYRMRLAANRADPKLAKRLDDLMGELLATARSANIHIIMLAQRGTVEYLPGDQKANLLQRLVGSTSSEAEVRYVLDKVPQKLPTPPGEFLVSTDEREPILVRVDQLTDRQFADVCRRGSGFTRPTAAGSTTPDDTETLTTDEPAPVLSPLEEAVVDILTNHPDGLSAAKILNRLPPDVAPPNATALGRALGQSGVVVWHKDGSGRYWSLQGSGRRETAVNDPSVTGGVTGR
jgi:hypothetical protein